ncbi:DUF2290 domain-containing protein [Solidesulfovibrio magneticus]|uniref:DUF2290 domain-containing protein n=1 Tax=Solidesulfovibrio magneticus (strain ATCC 700980 / DSM 13731 / RS-1) TaxID=573370 RepID=C4XQJ6_SOLM1|nr:DUF2290 domain-containing protein [Solidesulfovibrio magneticus]BAH75361.1 hypothetical protein DMR_18700 [Solidesulfovibrio magneticus RS-1]
MKDSLFYPQINECNNFLKEIGLLKEYFPNQSSPRNPGAFFRGLDYEKYWTEVYRRYYYTFYLEDNSLICFENKINGDDDYVCFTYLECPYAGDTYPNFLENLGGSYESDGDAFKAEYEQYICEQGIKQHVTPIRYEYRPDQHNPGIHPASHLHIGFRNDIRLGCGILFTPVMFVLFIVRQTYPILWQSMLSKGGSPLAERECRNLSLVNTIYLHDHDKYEPYLLPH